MSSSSARFSPWKYFPPVVSTTDFKAAYRTIMDDHFPSRMEIAFIEDDRRQTLCFEKAAWRIGDVEKGLRYGENPGQEAALYRLVNGNLTLGDVAADAGGSVGKGAIRSRRKSPR